MNGLICALQKFHLNPHNVRQTEKQNIGKSNVPRCCRYCTVLSCPFSREFGLAACFTRSCRANQNKTKNQKDIIIQSNKS